MDMTRSWIASWEDGWMGTRAGLRRGRAANQLPELRCGLGWVLPAPNMPSQSLGACVDGPLTLSSSALGRGAL